MGKHMEDALRKSADMLVQRLRKETARAQAAEQENLLLQRKLQFAEELLEEIADLEARPAHLFYPTETRYDGTRTKGIERAQAILKTELDAILRERSDDKKPLVGYDADLKYDL